MKKILVTGSSGFIGQHLLTKLENQGYNVTPADLKIGIDLSDKSVVEQLPDVDYVIHLAAYNGTKHFYEKPFDVIRHSILPTQYLLERYAGKVQKFLFAGTCESYAGAIDMFDYPVPTDEKVPLIVSDITNPRWSYGGSKIVNELQVLAAHHQYQQSFVIMRYHNVYGPHQVDHFIPEFIDRALTNNFKLFGHSNTRSFMYIDDAVDATLKILNSVEDEIINIGTQDEISIHNLAKIILEEMNIDAELIL